MTHLEELVKETEEQFAKFDQEYPGYLDFLSKLQLETIVKFKNLKFGEPRDITIRVVYREEIGVRGRCPGAGCIEYAVLDENFVLTKQHFDGFFPCQTFMSMRDWFRYSDSYEIISETEDESNERLISFKKLKKLNEEI